MADKEDLDSFLRLHNSFKLNEGKTRVICTLTGHELPCNVKELEAYINGKKYQQLTRKETCDVEQINRYKEYLIPSRNGKQKLFCTVTKKEINNIPHQIENHVIGRKFQRDLKIYEQRLNTVEKNEDVQAEEGGANSKIQKENNGVAHSTSEESEEELDDVSMDEDHDSEFVGGIWHPPGTAEDEDMAEEKSMEVVENKDTKKGSKKNLKRKIKNNKKSKLQNQSSQKRKR